LQSIGHNFELPPLPIFNSSSLYILIPDYTLPADGT
jgi:hypothetical protein